MIQRQPLVRDMDVVRGLLAYAAQHATEHQHISQPRLDHHSDALIAYHVSIMVEHNLMTGSKYTDESWGLGPLTWAGQDFLQAAQDDTVWNKAKERAGSGFNSLTLGVLKDLLVMVMREKLGLSS